MIQKYSLRFSILMLGTTLSMNYIYPHEIFSLRADLARKNGLNVDTIVKYTKAGGQRDLKYLNRIMYGATEYLTFEVRFPIFFEKKVSEINPGNERFSYFKTAGMDKIGFVSKVRIYHKYAFQLRNQIVAVAELLFPTARGTLTGIEKKPIIDSKSLDFLLGTAGSFETTKFYHFVSLSYRINTSAQSIHMGNQLAYSYSFGYRPEPPDVDKLDWVFLIDFDGLWATKDKVNRNALANTGQNILFTGLSFFMSKNNFMLKGGVQIPLYQHLNGIQEKNDFRAMLGAFIQF